jgi:hypothetical protein
MDAAPLLERTNFEAALPASESPHRSAWRTRMIGWQTRALLVALVMLLGLLHGTRTALGEVELATPPATPDVAAPPQHEPDWRRGHFYRPADSTAVRPPLVLRPNAWRPAPESPVPRIARSCAGGSC